MPGNSPRGTRAVKSKSGGAELARRLKHISPQTSNPGPSIFPVRSFRPEDPGESGGSVNLGFKQSCCVMITPRAKHGRAPPRLFCSRLPTLSILRPRAGRRRAELLHVGLSGSRYWPGALSSRSVRSEVESSTAGRRRKRKVADRKTQFAPLSANRAGRLDLRLDRPTSPGTIGRGRLGMRRRPAPRSRRALEACRAQHRGPVAKKRSRVGGRKRPGRACSF
jgi:hypothetical protein